MIFILVSLTCTKGYAQDIHFSQFLASPLLLNPAITGNIKGNINVVTNYRNQWLSITNPYQTYSLAGNINFKSLYGSTNSFPGIGLVIFRDQAGDAKFARTQAEMSFAYHIDLNNRNSLSAGLQGGLVQRSIDRSALKWDSQYDGTAHNPDLQGEETALFPSKAFLDMGFGMVWSFFTNDRNMVSNDGVYFTGGIALLHLAGTNQSLYDVYETRTRENIKMTGHGNASISIPQTNMAIQPALLYTSQSSVSEIIGGILFRYRLREASKYTGFIKGSAFSVGAYSRWNDAIIPMFKLEIANWAFGFSYDINTSSLSKVSDFRGGGEVFIQYITPNPFMPQKTSVKFF
ncbi:MAG: PorP/SprF family type IX secretion system membrane protein [Bacteroidia bacterium]|nr:PorP/SprF family type IX secretion system membrane protein [Bacteroidia bacterium]